MEHGPDAGASRPEHGTGPGSSFRGALSRGALGRGWGVCRAPVRCTRTRSYVPKREVSRGEGPPRAVPRPAGPALARHGPRNRFRAPRDGRGPWRRPGPVPCTGPSLLGHLWRVVG